MFHTPELTLLGLIIGVTFSMAVSRYAQRKNLKEEEANAIGTEYIPADLLPADQTSSTRSLLKSCLAQRILFYTTSNARQLRQINAVPSKIQGEM